MRRALVGRIVVVGASLAALAFAAGPAFGDVRQVGQTFFNDGSQNPNTDALALGVVGPPDKIATMVAAVYPSDTSQPANKLVILFPDKKAWAKFVEIWVKARHAKRPTEAQVYSNAADVGSYFDPVDEADINVSLDTDGGIDFALAGKPDAEKHPTVLTLIHLVPGDFKEFDRSVRAISAYFGK